MNRHRKEKKCTNYESAMLLTQSLAFTLLSPSLPAQSSHAINPNAILPLGMLSAQLTHVEQAKPIDWCARSV